MQNTTSVTSANGMSAAVHVSGTRSTIMTSAIAMSEKP